MQVQNLHASPTSLASKSNLLIPNLLGRTADLLSRELKGAMSFGEIYMRLTAHLYQFHHIAYPGPTHFELLPAPVERPPETLLSAAKNAKWQNMVRTPDAHIVAR